VVNDDEFGLRRVLRDLTYLAGFDSYGVLRRAEITTEIPGEMGCFMTTKETHKGIDKTSILCRQQKSTMCNQTSISPDH